MSSSTELHDGQAQVSSCAAVLAAIEQLLGVPDGLLPDGERADLADARERILARRVNVAVIGEFKRGKSTLVNALVGAQVVPTGVLPLTSAVTLVRYGAAERLLVHFLDGRDEEHPLDRLAHYATEAENPGNLMRVDLTVVETPSPLLAGGLQVIDTPGTGSVHLHNTRAAQSFFPRIDAAVVVLSADQPLSAAERELLATVDRMAGACLVVANRIDRLGADDRGRVAQFLRAALAEAGWTGEVLAVSATAGTGVEELRRAVSGLADPEADDVALAARSRAVLRAAALARSAAALEMRALDLPRAEIEGRSRNFAAQVNALAREAAAAALERSVAAALRDHVANPLRTLAEERAAALRAQLEAHAELHQGLSPRDLRRDLVAWVDERVRDCIEAAGSEREAAVSAELRRVADRYAAHVGEILSRLADGVAEAFGERPSWPAPRIALGERPPFHYKLRDEGEGLGDAVSAARTLVPGRGGRRLVVREARERLAGLVDRHAGRLRQQLDERTLTAIRAYQRELEATVEAAAAGVRSAVERSRHEVERGAGRVESRRAELLTVVSRCDRIVSDLTRAVPGRGGWGP